MKKYKRRFLVGMFCLVGGINGARVSLAATLPEQASIARVWHGKVLNAKAAEYKA